MKVRMLQGALCRTARVGGRSGSVNLWSWQSGSPNMKSNKCSLFLPVALAKGCNFECLVWTHSVRTLAGWSPPPAGSLCMVLLPQLGTYLEQLWRSKLSTNNKSVEGEKQVESLWRPFGPTYADVRMSRMPAYIGLRGIFALVLCVEMESMELNPGWLYCVQLMGHLCNSCCCCV